MTHNKVIFFDGVCNLCDRFISTLVDWDTTNQLKFAPQQGEYFQSQEIQSLVNKEMGDTIMYLRDGVLYAKSTAVLQAVSDMGGGWRLSLGFLVIPVLVRDTIYDFIAKNRYQIFGRKETCRLPTVAEKEKFIS